jgi:hypothetical protein
MRARYVLPALLTLAATGCVRAPPAAARSLEESAKCELVRTLMEEPLPRRYLSQLGVEGMEGPAPVLVFLRDPEQGLLERLFVGEPTCGGDSYRVVQHILTDSVVLYLQPAGEAGYTFDVQRSDPAGLALGGEPKGSVRREGGSWVASSD